MGYVSIYAGGMPPTVGIIIVYHMVYISILTGVSTVGVCCRYIVGIKAGTRRVVPIVIAGFIIVYLVYWVNIQPIRFIASRCSASALYIELMSTYIPLL